MYSYLKKAKEIDKIYKIFEFKIKNFVNNVMTLKLFLNQRLINFILLYLLAFANLFVVDVKLTRIRNVDSAKKNLQETPHLLF